MKVIIVSGTPGTGKTTYAKKLAKKKDYNYVDVKEIIEQKKLKETYDKKRQTFVVDTDKLNTILLKLIEDSREKGLVIDSHLSHYLPPGKVDKCIITKCDLKTLKERLEKRGYSKEKIRENLDVEIFDTCKVEALEVGHKIEVVYTD